MLAGVGDNRRRNPRQLSNLQTVTLVSWALFDTVQKNDALIMLGGFQVNINRIVVLLWQSGHFEVMRREQRKGFGIFGEVCSRRPGQRQAIKG